MKESELGDRFDKFRRVRNDINYYGKDISIVEAKLLIEKMLQYVEDLKSKFNFIYDT